MMNGEGRPIREVQKWLDEHIDEIANSVAKHILLPLEEAGIIKKKEPECEPEPERSEHTCATPLPESKYKYEPEYIHLHPTSHALYQNCRLCRIERTAVELLNALEACQRAFQHGGRPAYEDAEKRTEAAIQKAMERLEP